MNEFDITLSKEELAIAIHYITTHYDVLPNQLKYTGATRCAWKNDKAILATFHDTVVKTSRSVKLYWE